MFKSSPTWSDARGQVWFSWVLMGIAGATDAVGFLLFTGLYVSFMSGDATQTGVQLGQWNWSSVLEFLGAQLLFVCGVAMGHLVLYRVRRLSSAYLLLGEGLLLAAAGSAAVSLPADLGSAAVFIAFLCTVLAMGIQNAVLHQVAGTPVGTMVTGTLVRLGRALATRLAGGTLDAVADFGQWLFFVSGAALGAVGFAKVGAIAFLPSAAVALIVAVMLLRVRPQWTAHAD
ncbi:MAG: YoaK family protein [Mycobacterium sp.]